MTLVVLVHTFSSSLEEETSSTTGGALAIGKWPSPELDNLENASAGWCFIPTIWTMSNSMLDNQKAPSGEFASIIRDI